MIVTSSGAGRQVKAWLTKIVVGLQTKWDTLSTTRCQMILLVLHMDSVLSFTHLLKSLSMFSIWVCKTVHLHYFRSSQLLSSCILVSVTNVRLFSSLDDDILWILQWLSVKGKFHADVYTVLWGHLLYDCDICSVQIKDKNITGRNSWSSSMSGWHLIYALAHLWEGFLIHVCKESSYQQSRK